MKFLTVVTLAVFTTCVIDGFLVKKLKEKKEDQKAKKLSIQPVIMPLIVDHHAPVYVPPPPIPAPVVVAQPPARVIVAPQPPAPIVINRPPVAPFVHAPVVAPPVVAPVGALPPVPLAHPAAAPALILPHGPKLG